MADSIHYSLSAFRETMLTAIAKLEFELRDVCARKSEPSRPYYPHASRWMDEDSDTLSDIPKNDNEDVINQLARNVDILIKRVSSLELKDQIFTQKSCTTSVCKESDSNVSELLKFEAVKNTKNILVPSVRSTPALAAAVAAASANPPVFTLDSDEEGEEVEIIEEEHDKVDIKEESNKEEKIKEKQVDNKEEEIVETEQEEEEEEAEVVETEQEEIIEEEQEEEAEVVETEQEEIIEEQEEEAEVIETEQEEQVEEPELKQIKIKGKLYYKDEENNIYAETEDGYEQIGVYNPVTKDIEVVQDQEEDENDEDAIEVEEFIFKGKTYQRDTENNVYLEGEHIGTWNGKKIVLLE